MDMGLYIHVPFCTKKCDYCDFVSYAGAEAQMGRYADALRKDLARQGPLPAVDTVFFGGGTPSLPPPAWIPGVLADVRAQVVLLTGAEITCEANPGTLTAAHVAAWRAAGVNRLSLGAQAAQGRILRALGRAHDWEAVVQGAALWDHADGLSLDLMYGLPDQTLRDWQESLEAAVALRPGHLSCYALLLEGDTPMERAFERGALCLPSEEEERAMYHRAKAYLKQAGYVQYELSNWARDGRVCLHNLHTWQRGSYAALGCAAASFVKGVRAVNVRGLEAYIEAVEAGCSPVQESTRVSAQEAQYEELMLGLRLTQGITLSPAAAAHYLPRLALWERTGALCIEGSHVRLTDRGMDIMDSVLVDVL